MPIEIKGVYGKWKKVTRQQAKHFVSFLLQGILVGGHHHKVKIIEEKHLRGITVKELIENEDN